MNNKKFDINTLVGILLIGGIFLYFGFFNPSEKPVTEEDGQPDSAKVVEETKELREVEDRKTAGMPDTAGTNDSTLFGYGLPEETFTLENEVLEVVFSSEGGQIVKARLKNYRTYDSLPLYLINDNASFNIRLNGDQEFNTADLKFTGEKVSDKKIRFTLNAGEGKELRYEYSLQPDNYMLNWKVSSEGLGKMFEDYPSLEWTQQTLRHEKNIEAEQNTTQIEYRFANEDDVDDIGASGEREEQAENLKWIAYKQQFFSTILLHKNGKFNKAAMVSKPFPESETEKTKSLGAIVAFDEGDLNADLGLYLGPNKYNILKAYDLNFDELIPLGWGIFGWINRGLVINIFNWLQNYGLNYGVIILVIALVFKIILFPLTYSSYRSMAKMRVLKPEMDELNEKYKDKDPMKKQQATMELYRKAGVNPLGGCIPVLFQMPILIALFRFFPASIELRQQPFLWADDLSTYDSIMQLPFNIPFYGDHVSLFTLLMTVSTLIYTYMNQQLTGQNQQFPQMKYMVYLMPIVFLGVFNSYAAGLSYYYFVANMITFGQQFAIRSFIDEDKIHAKIQERKKQPAKENRFMRRMRELQEEQSRQARRRNK